MIPQPPDDAIPAATLIVARDGARGVELLMVERRRGLAFAAGALVFPGGRVDPGDRSLAERFGQASDDGETAARIAAIRETIEEAGVAIGLDPAPDAAAVAALQNGLAAGAGFAALLARQRLALDPATLTPWSRWCPNFPETRRFDTRFYLAAAPAALPPPRSDAGETVAAFWARPADILAHEAAGTAALIFPTRRNLERIAVQPDLAGLFAHAAAFPPRLITPWVEARDGVDEIVIPDDLGYPVVREPLSRVRRQ